MIAFSLATRNRECLLAFSITAFLHALNGRFQISCSTVTSYFFQTSSATTRSILRLDPRKLQLEYVADFAFGYEEHFSSPKISYFLRRWLIDPKLLPEYMNSVTHSAFPTPRSLIVSKSESTCML